MSIVSKVETSVYGPRYHYDDIKANPSSFINAPGSEISLLKHYGIFVSDKVKSLCKAMNAVEH